MLEQLVDGRYDFPGELTDFTNTEKLNVLKALNLTLPTLVKARKMERLREKYEAQGKPIDADAIRKMDSVGTKASNNSILQLRQVIALYKNLAPNTRLNRILAMLELPQEDIARIMQSPLVDGVRVAPRQLWYVTRSRDLITHMGDTRHFVSCFAPGGQYYDRAVSHARQATQGHAVMVYQIAEDGGLANRFLIRDSDIEIYDNPVGIQDHDDLWVDAVKNLNTNVALQTARTLLRIVNNPEEYAEREDRPVITEGNYPFQYRNR